MSSQIFKPRIRLLISYIFISYVIILIFSGGGHGSYTPFLIFFSWGMQLWLEGVLQNLIGFFIFPILYIIILFNITNFMRKLENSILLATSPIIHSMGIIYGYTHLEQGHLATTQIIITGQFISLIILSIYFYIDLKLIKRHHMSIKSK